MFDVYISQIVGMDDVLANDREAQYRKFFVFALCPLEG